VILEIRARVAELRALALDERAQSRDDVVAGRLASTEDQRRAAFDRAERSHERAQDYAARAEALAAEHGAGAEGAPPPDGAEPGEPADARWARAHAARERADAARARHDDSAAALDEEDARAQGQLALAAEQRAEAAGHDARAERVHQALANGEPEARRRLGAERDARIEARRARERAGLRRVRPGPGSVFFSPAMAGTAGASDRFAAVAEHEHDREVEAIAATLAEEGAAGREELRRRVGGRQWGPGRFAAALRAALREGRVRRDEQGRYDARSG
jgi:hypothetical protein